MLMFQYIEIIICEVALFKNKALKAIIQKNKECIERRVVEPVKSLFLLKMGLLGSQL